jgi:predicted metal-binding membrane protein
MDHTRADPLLVQRNVVLGLLLVLAAASWALLDWQGSGTDMGMAMASPTMGMRAPLFLAIWVVMMVAMMFPTAAPMILTFHKVQTSKRQRGEAFVATWIFVAAYMVVWAVSGVTAYAGALAAEAIAARAALSSATTARIGGGVILVAGLYQLTPLKDVCLSKCRTPISFIMTSWRDGTAGALHMGLLHGAYCLGCCWLLFVVLFPLGIMNNAAMAVITLLVFAEKTLPWGRPVVRVIAAALVALGVTVLAEPRVLPTFMADGMGMAAASAPTGTTAAHPDYRLEVVEARPSGPGKTIVTVRLVHVPDGRPIEGAVILEAKTDMGPGGMPEMSGKVTPLPSDQPGIYRFLIETGMTGKWELIIGVKVEGEAETVRNAITYDVTS